MYRKVWTIKQILGFTGAILFALSLSNCNNPVNPTVLYPANIEVVINGGVEATNDSVLTVQVIGENIDQMKLSLDSSLTSQPWIEYQEYSVFHAPREDGVVTVYAKLRTMGGGSTGVNTDDIRLDFTAVIDSVSVSIPNYPVYAGDLVEFNLWTSESGLATINYASTGLEVDLSEVQSGHFMAEASVPRGVNDPEAITVGFFIDEVGNVATPDTATLVMNIAGPRLSPRIVGELSMIGSAGFDVVFRSDHCIISDNEKVQVVNVQDPEDPELVLTVNAGSWNGKMYPYEDRLYLPHRDGLAILNVQPVTNTRVLENLYLGGYPRDMKVANGYSYVSCFHEGLKILDLQVISEPQIIGSLRILSYGERILLKDRVAYIFGGGGGQTINVTNNSEPDTIGYIHYENTPNEVEFYNDYIIMASDAGLFLFDASDPANVIELQHVETDTFATSLELMPPYIFLGGHQQYISVYNLTVHEEMQEIGRIQGAGKVKGICIKDEMMYAVKPEGLYMIELFEED
ncbi:LVIVD repeat-containing protein [Calditrichota bacterium]